MRRLLCVILAVLAALPALAAAKTVLFVTSNDACWHGQCGCLSAEEETFCEHLGSIGYTVVITSEGHVISNSQQWRNDWRSSDMIFLGDLSSNALNTSAQQQAFCNGINATISDGRKIFATFGSVRNTPPLVGCAVSAPMTIVNTPQYNNCTAMGVGITQAGYITKGWTVDSTTPVYDLALPMTVHNGNDWIGVSCNIGGMTKLWSVLATKDKGTFWGLDRPSAFNSGTWTLFERAIIYTMGDHVWGVNAFTIPETPTAGQPFWIAAKIYDRGKEVTDGTVVTIQDGLRQGNLRWENTSKHWVNRTTVLPQTSNLIISSEQGNATLQVRTGNLTVNIMFGNYQAGKYNLQADVKSGLETVFADVKYKIRSTNLSVLANGTINIVNGIYQTEVALADSGDLIIEVDARTSTDTGGSVKAISSKQLLKRGIDWTLDPAELQLSSTKPGSETVTFTIGSITSKITNIKVSARGELAGSTFIQGAGVPTSLNAKESKSFNVTLDWTGLEKREYTGSLLFESDQFSDEIPIKFFYLDVPGNWINVQPKLWSVTVPVGKKSTQTFSIFNNAPYVTSAISIRPSAEFGKMITVKRKPWWVLSDGTADFDLAVDGTGAKEGMKTGTVTVSSSLGSVEIPVTITVIADLMQVRQQLASNLSAARTRMSEITWADVTELQSKAAAVNSSLAQFDAAWGSGDWSTAGSSIDRAGSQLMELQDGLDKIGPPFPWDLLLVAAGIAGAGVASFFGYKWLKKRQKKEKVKEEQQEQEDENELPNAEDQYRTEWY